MSEDSSVDEVEQECFWYCYDNIGFPKRVNHAVTAHVDENSGGVSVFSIGGFTEVEPGSDHLKSSDIDVHKFDVVSRTWNFIKTRSKKDDPCLAPCAKSRCGHSVCSYNRKIYMFGGHNNDDGLITGVSCFDVATSSWQNCKTSGQSPGARDGHACTLIGSTMFIHGGYSKMHFRFTNSLYGLNLDTLVWELYPCVGPCVRERDFHTATAIGKNKIVVYGGRCVQQIFAASSFFYDQSFYCYDIQDGKWSEMNTTGYKPMGRRSHTAAHCRESVVYFGGSNSILNKHFADLFMLNVTTNHITEVRPWGEYPCARRRPACVLVGSELIICGGTSLLPTKEYIDHSDTFILNLFPTLQEICLSHILNNGMDYSVLPPHLSSYLKELRCIDEKRYEDEFKVNPIL